MRTVKLEAVQDLATGEVGLIASGMKLFDYPMTAHSGSLIAHDLIEHQQGVRNIGSIDDELIALGACWYIRGQFHDLDRQHFSNIAAEAQLGSDVANLARHYNEGVAFRGAVPATRPCRHDEAFHAILEQGQALFAREQESGEEPTDASRMTAYFAAALHCLRRGYRLAHRRFGDPLNANALFWAIADAVEPHARVDYAGQRYQPMRYGNCEAICDEHELEPY